MNFLQTSKIVAVSIFFSSSIYFFSCGEKVKTKEPGFYSDFIPALRQKQAAFVAEAEALRDPATGWLAVTDCDGMLWAGKYGSSSPELCNEVNLQAAEFENEPGRYGRRPPPFCHDPVEGDQGARTTWSRDMAVGGLFPYAYRCNRLDILEAHAAYGAANSWNMGKPFADGRAVYTPNVLGLLHKAIASLGGDGSAHSYWPDSYPAGLTDYEAHLQVSQIWLRGEIEKKQGGSDVIVKPEAALLDVSGQMYARLEEHAKREPKAAFYQTIFARYSGDYGPAIDSCLENDLEASAGSYVRCENRRECLLSDRLFACSLLIEYLGG